MDRKIFRKSKIVKDIDFLRCFSVLFIFVGISIMIVGYSINPAYYDVIRDSFTLATLGFIVLIASSMFAIIMTTLHYYLSSKSSNN